MNRELDLNNEYVEELVDSVEEVIPFLLKQLPVTAIPRTEKSNALVETLRQDSDSIHAYIEKFCEVDTDCQVSKQSFYEKYVQFCVENGREAHKKHSFMRSMRSLGFTENRDPKTREAIWKGVGFKK